METNESGFDEGPRKEELEELLNQKSAAVGLDFGTASISGATREEYSGK